MIHITYLNLVPFRYTSIIRIMAVSEESLLFEGIPNLPATHKYQNSQNQYMEELGSEEKLNRLKRKQKLAEEYESALDGNATLNLAGYDHIEGPDFYEKNELLDAKYLKKGEKALGEKKDEPVEDPAASEEGKTK